MNFTNYLFDFDGTLVDSMPYWSRKMLNILNETNTPYPENVISIITPLGDAGTAVYFRETLGVPLTEAEMFEKMFNFYKLITLYVCVFYTFLVLYKYNLYLSELFVKTCKR